MTGSAKGLQVLIIPRIAAVDDRKDVIDLGRSNSPAMFAGGVLFDLEDAKDFPSACPVDVAPDRAKAIGSLWCWM
jgi:hypothetical protein